MNLHVPIRRNVDFFSFESPLYSPKLKRPFLKIYMSLGVPAAHVLMPALRVEWNARLPRRRMRKEFENRDVDYQSKGKSNQLNTFKNRVVLHNG